MIKKSLIMNSLVGVGIIILLSLVFIIAGGDDFLVIPLILLLIYAAFYRRKTKMQQYSISNNRILLVFSLLVGILTTIIGGYFLILGIMLGWGGVIFVGVWGLIILAVGVLLVINTLKRNKGLKNIESTGPSAQIEHSNDQRYGNHNKKNLIIILCLILIAVIYQFFPQVWRQHFYADTPDQKEALNKCYLSNNENLRFGCISKVAVDYNNEKLCEEIPRYNDYYGGCYMDVAESVRNYELCVKALGWENECYEKVAILIGDESLCDDKAKMGYYQIACYREIAKSKKDVALCDKLKTNFGLDDWDVERCYKEVTAEN